MILHGRRKAVERLELQPDSRVLEVGCGTGLNFRFMLEKLDPQRGTLVGLDFSQDMLDRAAARVARKQWTNVSLLQADATQLALNRQFDVIFFAYSLTMIPNWPEALRRAYEHLAPGGRLGVLDFGKFQRWGPLAPVMRGWLRANHVETLQPYPETVREVCGNLELHHWCGGYNFTAIGRRSA
jgi:ubiquinone/menaquinone biosynthesis C-methylase UbiE